MNKFVLLYGPQAVGKMTVGHELEKITDLKLFHNHMTIDFALQFFDHSSPFRRKTSDALREAFFEVVRSSDLEGIIFTYVWAFDLKEDWEYVERITTLFEEKNCTVYYVELESSMEKRLERNSTEHQLLHKPSKRNQTESEHDLRRSFEQHRLNSEEGEITHARYMRINNEHMSPADVAQKIKAFMYELE